MYMGYMSLYRCAEFNMGGKCAVLNTRVIIGGIFHTSQTKYIFYLGLLYKCYYYGNRCTSVKRFSLFSMSVNVHVCDIHMGARLGVCLGTGSASFTYYHMAKYLSRQKVKWNKMEKNISWTDYNIGTDHA